MQHYDGLLLLFVILALDMMSAIHAARLLTLPNLNWTILSLNSVTLGAIFMRVQTFSLGIKPLKEARKTAVIILT